jgi:hypothetical protein
MTPPLWLKGCDNQEGVPSIMSSQNDWNYEDDEDFEESESGPAGLRKALKEAQKELKAAKAQIFEQGKTIRSRSISDALAASGLPSKISSLVPNDIENSEEAIQAWISTYSDIFQGTGIPNTEADGEAPAFTDEELDAKAVIDRTASVVSSPASAADKAARMSGADTQEELMAAIRGGNQ